MTSFDINHQQKLVSERSNRNEIVSVAQMKKADELSIHEKRDGFQLMFEAGRQIAAHCLKYCSKAQSIYILCGKGNNGGDGFVAAHFLQQAGKKVEVYAAQGLDKYAGDAAKAASLWHGIYLTLDSLSNKIRCDLIVDGLIGAGLKGDLNSNISDAVDKINSADCPVLSIDVPTGINGDAPATIPDSFIQATHSVTFARLKLAHVLQPYKAYCGQVFCYDIGIQDNVFDNTGCVARINGKSISLENDQVIHKYNNGHVGVFAGSASGAGASRLASGAAMRYGAGLVSLICASEDIAVFAAQNL